MQIPLSLIAFVPIILAIVLMGVYSWSARKATGVCMFISLIISIIYWHMDPIWIKASIINGTLLSLKILWVLFGAIFLLLILQKSNSMKVIINNFKSLTNDSRIEAILIAFLFGAFIEAIAGFGAPAAIAAPLLVALNFPALAAVTIALLFNTAPVSFGAIGTPIILGINSVVNLSPEQTHTLGIYVAAIHAIAFLILPTIFIGFMTKLFSKEKSFMLGIKAWKFSLACSATFSIFYFLTAYFIGPELPSVVGSIVAIIVGITLVKKKIFMPEKTWSFHSGKVLKYKRENLTSSIKAWTPYMLIVLILILTRVRSLSLGSYLQQFAIKISSISSSTLNFSFEYLYTPGTIFFIVAVLSALFLYKIKTSDIFDISKDTFVKLWPATISLICTLIMIQIMINSSNNSLGLQSMLLMPAEQLSNSVGKAWIFFSAPIGALGAFVAGSNTVSNILFGFLQYNIAEKVGLSVLLILAMQIVGGAIGNMICIHNIVAACSTVELQHKEGEILRANAIPFLLYIALVCLIGVILMYFI